MNIVIDKNWMHPEGLGSLRAKKTMEHTEKSKTHAEKGRKSSNSTLCPYTAGSGLLSRYGPLHSFTFHLKHSLKNFYISNK